MTGAAAVESLLRGQLTDATCTWSLGSYGARATFCRAPDEPVRPLADGRFGLATERGAIALAPSPDLRPFAYETGFVDGWSQAVALCLPADACAMGRRTVVTELGPDTDAARPADRAARLFDLGLGLAAAAVCARTADPATLARLRACLGRPLPVPGAIFEDPTVRADAVFVARVGRIEVYAAADRRGCGALGGPRVHVLPRVLRGGRTHPATAPIPTGLVPCATLHPRHPCAGEPGRPAAFDPARHAAFGRILDIWGDPALVALRRAVLAGEAPAPAAITGRFARSALRAAQAQVRAAGA